MTQTTLEDLLMQWENQRQLGKTASVDELCHACPHLKKDLFARIQALEKMNQVLNSASVSVVSERTFRQRTRYDDLRPNWEPIPGYRLEKKLGKGGFGEVWKATGPGGFSVALKFVSMSSNLGASELRSLEVIKTLRHPNLLATFGSWQAHGFLIIAMELADRSLLDRLQEAQNQGLTGIPRDELIDYMQEAAKGIDYLNQPVHRLGDSTKAAVQHRDIKPQNILLMGGGIKIGDFGIVRILKTTVTEENGSLTLSYAPPEIILGHAARSSDQYSLAVTYCHLRGGRLPFAGHPGQVMDGHLKNPPDLSMLPKAEREAVARALDKDPKQRWPTCGEFVSELAKCHDPNESSTTYVVPNVEQASMPKKARAKSFPTRLIRLLISLAAIFLIVTLIWSLGSQFRDEAQHDQQDGADAGLLTSKDDKNGHGDKTGGQKGSGEKNTDIQSKMPNGKDKIAERPSEGTQSQPTDPNFQISPLVVKKKGMPYTLEYFPKGSAWKVTGAAFLQHNGSIWGYANSPITGTNQTACMQYDASISQTFSWSTGPHTVSVWLQQRPGYGNLPVNVMIDGVAVATFTPTGTWTKFTTPSFTISTPGNHELKFSTRKVGDSDQCTGIVGIVVH